MLTPKELAEIEAEVTHYEQKRAACVKPLKRFSAAVDGYPTRVSQILPILWK